MNRPNLELLRYAQCNLCLFAFLLLSSSIYSQKEDYRSLALKQTIASQYNVTQVKLDTLDEGRFLVHCTQDKKRVTGLYDNLKMVLPPIFISKKENSSSDKICLGISGQYGIYDIPSGKWDFKMLHRNIAWIKDADKFLMEKHEGKWVVLDADFEEIHEFEENVIVKIGGIGSKVSYTKKGKETVSGIYDLKSMKSVFEGNYRYLRKYDLKNDIWSASDNESNRFLIFNNGAVLKRANSYGGLDKVVMDGVQYYIGYESERGIIVYNASGELYTQGNYSMLTGNKSVHNNFNLVSRSLDTLHGVVDAQFKEIVPTNNQIIHRFGNGFIRKKNDKWSHFSLDENNQVVNSNWGELDDVMEMKWAQQDAAVLGTKKGETFVLDTLGMQRCRCDTLISINFNERYFACVQKKEISYYDKEFKFIEKFKKKFKSDYSPDYTRQMLNLRLISLESEKGKYIYNLKTKKTQEALEPSYPLKNENLIYNKPFIFQKNGKKGLGTLDGTILLAPSYDNIVPLKYHYLGFKDKKIFKIRT